MPWVPSVASHTTGKPGLWSRSHCLPTMTEAHHSRTKLMRNFKGCASCLHEDEDGEGPNCGPCLQAWSEDRLEPNWAPKEAAGCGGTMCHTPTCSDCFPKDIRSEEHTSELQSLMRNSYAV